MSPTQSSSSTASGSTTILISSAVMATTIEAFYNPQILPDYRRDYFQLKQNQHHQLKSMTQKRITIGSSPWTRHIPNYVRGRLCSPFANSMCTTSYKIVNRQAPFNLPYKR